MNTTDMAIVNVPLARRGNIDAQLDRHNAKVRMALDVKAKINAAEFQGKKDLAKSLWESEQTKIMEKIQAISKSRPETSVRVMMATVKSWVNGNPGTFIKWVAAA